jgi:hypothetical protein
MLVGRLPFDSENVPQLLSAIVHGRYEIPREVRGSSRDLVERMLCVDTSRRITVSPRPFLRILLMNIDEMGEQIDEIIKHPYLRSHPVDIDSTLPYGLIPGSFDLVPRTREELDDGVLDNLRIVMQVEDVEDVVHSLLSKEYVHEFLYSALTTYSCMDPKVIRPEQKCSIRSSQTSSHDPPTRPPVPSPAIPSFQCPANVSRQHLSPVSSSERRVIVDPFLSLSFSDSGRRANPWSLSRLLRRLQPSPPSALLPSLCDQVQDLAYRPSLNAPPRRLPLLHL